MSNNVPKIPQNKEDFFLFYFNEKMFYLDINFNHIKKINYENLFLILKFYSLNEELLIKSIYINSSEINNLTPFNINIFHYVNLNKLKKMNFFEFKEWFIDLKDNDYEYIKNLKYYGFRIVFFENSTYFKEKKIFPVFPWSENFKNLYIKKKKNILFFDKWLIKNNFYLYRKWIKEKGRLYR